MNKSRTTPYHPAGNGTTERMNRTLLDMLGTLDPDKKHNWKAEVSPLVHAYNCTKHSTTGFSPYALMFGRQPRLALDVVLGIANQDSTHQDYGKYMESLRSHLNRAYELATAHSKTSQHRQKVNYDHKTRGAVVETGDRVLVKVVAFDGKHKIADRWEDVPYIVSKRPNNDIPVYVVKREDGVSKQRTLHRNVLLPIGFLPLDTPDKGKKNTNDKTLKHVKGNNKVSESHLNDIQLDDDRDEDVDEEYYDYKLIETEQTPDEGELSDSITESEVEMDRTEDIEPQDTEVNSNESSSDDSLDQESDIDIEVDNDYVTHVKVPEPVQVKVSPPKPAPRRSLRNKTKPSWMESGQYAMSQVAKPQKSELAELILTELVKSINSSQQNVQTAFDILRQSNS